MAPKQFARQGNLLLDAVRASLSVSQVTSSIVEHVEPVSE